MSDYSDFVAQIAEWSNRADWSPALVSSFVRMAEQKLNAELRIDRMIKTAQNMVTCGCGTLPDDWLESDLVLIAANTPTGWMPIRYKPRDEFFRLPDTTHTSTYAWNTNSTFGYYTMEGRTLFFGGPVDATEGTLFQISYYGEVPVFADDQDSWVYTKFPSLYLSAAMMHAYLHAVGEEAQAAGAKQLTEDQIGKLNATHQYAKASGSRLARAKVRSFG